MIYPKNIGGNGPVPGPAPTGVPTRTPQPARTAPAAHQSNGPFDLSGATQYALTALATMPYSGFGLIELYMSVGADALERAINSAVKAKGNDYCADIRVHNPGRAGTYSVNIFKKKRGVWD